MRVQLANKNLQLELDPAAGGTVSALKYHDLELLRAGPMRSGPAFDPRQYAAFPMVPFVGRIHNGRFTINGDAIKLHPNLPPEPHAIHGFGWQSAWQVETQTNQSTTLVHEHVACAWPWNYTAKQSFQLEEHALVLEMRVSNRGSKAMPAGLGWHPYFLRKGASLRLPTTHEWHPDEETGENHRVDVSAEKDLSQARSVECLNLDTAFSVSEPLIEMTWPTHKLKMESDPVFTHATVYVPKGEDYFCAEPISHAPNAVNSDLPDAVTGRRWLEPDETLSGTIRLSVER